MSFARESCIPLLAGEASRLTNCVRLDLSLSKCVECVAPFVVDGDGVCRQFQDENCSEFHSLGCKRCKDGFLKVDLAGTALPVSQCRANAEVRAYSLVENCLTHDHNGFCLKCAAGFALNFNNLSCHQLANCSIFDSRKRMCVQCFDGFFVHGSGSCQKGVLSDCARYSGEFECFTCQDGFLLKSFFKANGALDYRRCVRQNSIGSPAPRVTPEHCIEAEESNGVFQCRVCDFNFRPEFEAEMKKQSISYKSNVNCLKQETMPDCQRYDPRRLACLECAPGFDIKVDIKETLVATTPSTATARASKGRLGRLLETADSEGEDDNPLSSIDDSAKEILFETVKSCQAKQDIPHCLEHSSDKRTCLQCETGRIYNNSANECQFILLVPRGCLKYGPYNSCYRCIKDHYLNEVHDCVPVEQPVAHCHLYNTFQKCSLCRKGFALSRDKTR